MLCCMYPCLVARTTVEFWPKLLMVTRTPSSLVVPSVGNASSICRRITTQPPYKVLLFRTPLPISLGFPAASSPYLACVFDPTARRIKKKLASDSLCQSSKLCGYKKTRTRARMYPTASPLLIQNERYSTIDSLV